MDAQSLTHAEVRLPENDLSVALARDFTRRTLAGWGHQSWQDAVQVVSELVSNALLHAHGSPVLRLIPAPAGVRVEVVDDSPLRPAIVRSGSGGFGLRLVERLATTWGVCGQGRGKVVWCELPANPDPALG